MILIRKWALALCLVLLSSSFSNAQTTDSVTGNLINYGSSSTDTTSTWNNGVYVNSLTCWRGGDPGNCGPNPSVRPGGYINYSYGTVDLNQVVNINKALAAGGSGVQLSGFNFGFTAKNGNGWDNGQQDYLSAYVRLYNSNGSLASNYDYTATTNRKYNWTTFNFSETLASPVAASSYGNAQVGFVGRDTNFWAGTYGPEIMNVNFSLKYSVKPDPCISDPLSSPTCPGYALATVKNSLLGSTVSNASVTSYVPTITSTSTAPAVADAAPALAQASPQQQAQQPASSPPPQQQPGQDPNQNPSVAQDNPAQPSPQQAGPAPTQPQPAGGPPQTASASAPPPSSSPQQAGPGKSNDGPKMTPSAALSVARAAQEKDKAVQAAAVQAAAKTLDGSMQSSQASSNAAISMNQDMSANSATAAAQFASQTTQTNMQTATQSGQLQNTQQTFSSGSQSSAQLALSIQNNQSTQIQNNQASGSIMLRPPTTPMEATSQTSSGTGLTVNRSSTLGINAYSLTNTMTQQVTVSPPPVMQLRNESKFAEIEVPPVQLASFGGSRVGNPLSDMMQQRFEMMQTNIEQRTESVKRDVQPNDLAGGVDLASMALQPKGFEAYSVVLRDSAFYEPKEVYKGQTVIDNARALRQLGSDRLHQEMVNSQYKQGE